MDKSEIVRSIRAERRGSLALLRSIDPGQFDTPTALPGWRIREIVAHLITTDRASVTGTIIPVAFRSMDRLETWNDRQVPGWANRAVPDLLVALERWGRRFAWLVDAIPSPLYHVPLPSPWGRVGGLVVWVRAYDEWVHRQDIRRALGMPAEDVDLASVAEFLLTSIAHVALPGRIHLAGTVDLALEGIPVPEWRYDLAARSAGPKRSGEARARVISPAPDFIMAAAGRDRFEALASTGILSIEGDQDLAWTFLSRIRIV